MSALDSAASPFHDLVLESLDEAAFLWWRWEAELTSLTRNLDEVWSWTEDRLHGALDGVRAAGDGMIDVAATGLLSKELPRVTVSAALLASSSEPGALDTLAAAFAVAEADALAAMVRGVEVLGSAHALGVAQAGLPSRGPAGVAALLQMNTFRRVRPGAEVRTALGSNAPGLQAAAVRAASYLPSSDLQPLLGAALRSEDAPLRRAAIESGIGHGLPQALEAATRLAAGHDAESGPYLNLVALFGTAEQQETIYAALRIPHLQREAIWALGHVGTARAAEACLAGMKYENLARACGEAYCWITGADLERDRLAAAEKATEVPAFEDDDLDANLVPAPEESWPLPDPDAVAAHWIARKADFAAAGRYIRGTPVSAETLLSTVESGPMLRRPDLILELRARTRGRYDVEPRALVARQRQMMAAGRAAAAGRGGS